MNALATITMPLGAAALDRLMPMHLLLTPNGQIRHAGPTLRKLLPDDLQGGVFSDLFAVRRPHGYHRVQDLTEAGERVNLELRGRTKCKLKGQAVALADGSCLLNLSHGISVVDSIKEFGLTAADFAPTDLTIELFYLVEAKAAVERESQRLNERLKEAKRKAEAQALADTLTGLGNRRAMDEMLNRLLGLGQAFGLMHLDLDFFKEVNDSMGHAAGDHVLCEVAEVLRTVTRNEDLVARVGGDEFVLLLRGVTDPEGLIETGRRLIEGIQRPIRWQGRYCKVAASIGATSTALYRRPDADRMLSDADEALYCSKRAGRALVTMAPNSDLAGVPTRVPARVLRD